MAHTALFAIAALSHAPPHKTRLPALRMRGGAVTAASFLLASAGADAAAAASPAYHLTNCAAGAAGFFGNVRIPAALLTGAAIGQLWTKLDDSRGKRVPVLFSVLVATAVASELAVVFTSTAISTKMMGSTFDPMATCPLELLMREFELPFIGCRVHFFVGLLSFVGALALRVWTAFPGSLGNGLAMLLVSVGCTMNAVFSTTVDHYRFGLLGLVVRYVELFFMHVAPSPSGVSALATLAVAGYFFAKATKEEHAKAD